MKNVRGLFPLLFSCLWLGCGPNIERVDPSTGGSGGAAGEGGAGGIGGAGGSAGTGAGGGSAVMCTSLEVKTTTFAMTAIAQFLPQIKLISSSGRLLYSFKNAPPPAIGSLYAMEADAFDNWPPAWTPAQEIDSDVESYVLGNGPTEPIALIRHGSKSPVLADKVTPMLNVVNAPITDNGTPMFVTAIPNRFFWAQVFGVNAYDIVHFGSYEPNSLPQTEDPTLCVLSRPSAHAIPSNNGFLVASVEAKSPETACAAGSTTTGTVVGLARYDVPGGAGGSLARTQGDRLLGEEPIVNLGLAGTSFGGWMVMQADGSTSVTPPPLVAHRITTQGTFLDPNKSVDISGPGFVSPALAVTSLGDTLAAAFVDNVDPSAPVVIVRLVDGTAQSNVSTAIPTNDAWFTENLQIVASMDQRSLIVAWSANNVTAFSRIDCIP